MTVTVLHVSPAKEYRLDPIRAYFDDIGPGYGQLTLVCYGKAWSAYFGGTGADSVQDFVMKVSKDYLVSKLYNEQFSRTTKKEIEYLGRVVQAVQNELDRLYKKEN